MRVVRYGAIFALNAIEYSSISLTYAAVPVVLRANGASLETVGIFGVLIFAFVLCLAWAPLVDRYSLTRWGRRRSWIGITQIATAALVGVLALAEPSADMVWPVFGLCLAISVVAATQRIAVLGYMAETLAPAERGFGATAGGIGAAIGHLIGGAFTLYLVESFGWQTALTAFAIGLAVCGLIVIFMREADTSDQPPAPKAISWSILKDRRAWAILGAMAPATIGLATAFAMSEPRLVDLGFGLAQVGLIAGIANLAAFAVIGPVTSFLIRDRAPEHALVSVLVLAAGAFAIAIGIGYAHVSAGGVVGIVVIFGAFCAMHVAVTAMFMALCRPESAGTDLTALVACQSLIAMPGFMASGFLAAAAGHQAPLFAAAIGGVLSLVLVLRFMAGTEAPRPRRNAV